MTANALKGDRELCIDAGMDDYISKPVRQKDFLEVLLKYCKTKVFIPSETIKILVVDEDKETLGITANQHSLESTKGKTDAHGPVFNISDTLACAGNDVTRMKRLIDITLEDSKKQMEQLSVSLAAGDGPVVERIAHTLKSQAANIGAGPFRESAQRMEKAAKDGDLQSVRNIMEEFEKEYQRLNKALEEIDWDRVE